MVAIVVYSHVYGGWHAASPATCPTPHSQVHGTPCRRYGCPGRRRSPGPAGRIDTQQLHLVQYRGTLLTENLPELFLISGRYQLLHGGHGGTVFLQCHVTQTRGTSLRVIGKRCFPSVRHDPMSEGGSKGCKTPHNSRVYLTACGC